MQRFGQPFEDEMKTGERDGCIPNISPAEQRKRLLAGAIQLVVGLAILAALIALDAGRQWRLVLFVPFWGAAVGYFQARDRTWLRLAARGARKLGDRAEPIDDPAIRAQIRRQARRVLLRSTLAGLILTLLALVIPV